MGCGASSSSSKRYAQEHEDHIGDQLNTPEPATVHMSSHSMHAAASKPGTEKETHEKKKIIKIDTTGDGRADIVKKDSHKSGKYDTLLQDTTGDGVFDTKCEDTTGDGKVNRVMKDTTGDGKADTVKQDTRGDGHVDYVLKDTTGDGRMDLVQIDTRGTGHFNVISKDTSGDGKHDHYEFDTTGNKKKDFVINVIAPEPVSETDEIKNKTSSGLLALKGQDKHQSERMPESLS
mmetsp:Transcript_716/g.1340  ORF Transcript_716/g.1340 Transcript_716/m.1340 type:complete len:233 (+) Transcript_716:72-770(+)